MEHGLDRGVEPIAPLNDNRQSGIDFPKDALGALAAMRHHPVVNEGLGSEFVMVYCENKYQEQLDFMRHIDAREYRWFFDWRSNSDLSTFEYHAQYRFAGGRYATCARYWHYRMHQHD
jgi:hypothetical protein